MGGNAPGIAAKIEFRFPPDHTQPVARDHTQSVVRTRAIHGSPLRTPNKEQPKMNLNAPGFALVAVAPGSADAVRWDGWLKREEYPPLAEIAEPNFDGHYLVPVTTAPDKSATTPYRIALRWAEQLRSKA
jgi:hypothetical protein